MIPLGPVLCQHTCPDCSTVSCSYITIEIVDFGTRIRKSVADACPKCGKKLTQEKEFERELTQEEIDELYPQKRRKQQ